MVRDLRQQIHASADELRRLHARVRETFALRGKDRRAWSDACAEFHARYDALAFPGGYAGAPERLAAGDSATMEAALVFLELRPYFFRSGYMHKKLMRCAKRAPFSKAQAQRFRIVLERAAEWRARKRAGCARRLSMAELRQFLAVQADEGPNG
jgi:hypothetical protein